MVSASVMSPRMRKCMSYRRRGSRLGQNVRGADAALTNEVERPDTCAFSATRAQNSETRSRRTSTAPSRPAPTVRTHLSLYVFKRYAAAGTKARTSLGDTLQKPRVVLQAV